jgi:hypothetical protein
MKARFRIETRFQGSDQPKIPSVQLVCQVWQL